MIRVLILLSLCLHSCYIDIEGKPLRGKEDRALIPAFRLRTDFGPRRGEEPGLRMGLQAELEKVSGDFNLQVAPGELLRIQGTPTTGQVYTKFDAIHSAVLFRIAHRTPQGLELGLFTGPSVLDMDLELDDGLLREIQNKDRIGWRVGLDLSYEFNPWLGSYLRAHHDGMSHSGSARSLETGLSLKATQELQGFIGWRYWNLEEDEMWDGRNDVDLEARGLVLGLQLRF